MPGVYFNENEIKFLEMLLHLQSRGQGFVSARGGIFSFKQRSNLGLPPSIADPNMPPTACWKADML